MKRITRRNYKDEYGLDNQMYSIIKPKIRKTRLKKPKVKKEKRVYPKICLGCGEVIEFKKRAESLRKFFTCSDKCRDIFITQRTICNLDKNKNTCYKCKKIFKKVLIRVGKRTTTFVCTKCNTSRAKQYRNTGSGKIAIKKALQKSNEIYREKTKARQMVNRSVTLGDIIKPKTCSDCGLHKKLDGHHEDYSKPLDVIWLCRYCHMQRHRKPVDNVLAMVESVL